MPRRDGTGPIGQGSYTGRGRGFCFNSSTLDNHLRLNSKDFLSMSEEEKKSFLNEKEVLLKEELTQIQKIKDFLVSKK